MLVSVSMRFAQELQFDRLVPLSLFPHNFFLLKLSKTKSIVEENIASALNVFPLPPGGTAAKCGRQCFRGEMNLLAALNVFSQQRINVRGLF